MNNESNLNQASENNSVPAPNYFECPISLTLFEDPVAAKDGYTYERNFIENHIRNRGKSPMNREPIEINILYPNIAIKNAIRDGNYSEA